MIAAAVIIIIIIISVIAPAITLVLLRCRGVLAHHQKARLSEGALEESKWQRGFS